MLSSNIFVSGSFFHLTLSTGRAAGTVSCAAPSTIALTTRGSWTTSAARREATPKGGLVSLSPRCTRDHLPAATTTDDRIVQKLHGNYWCSSTFKHLAIDHVKLFLSTSSILHSAMWNLDRVRKCGAHAEFFSPPDPRGTWQRDRIEAPLLLLLVVLCRNRRSVGRFGDDSNWIAPQVSHARDGVFAPMVRDAEMAMAMRVQRLPSMNEPPPIPCRRLALQRSLTAQNFVSASLSEVTVRRQHGRVPSTSQIAS